MRTLSAFLVLIMLWSCGGSDTSKNTNSKTKTDSTTTPVVAKNITPKDTLQALKLDVSYTCEEARQKIGSNKYEISEMNILLMKAAQCKNEEYNKNHPDSAYVTVVTEEVDADGNGKILFNTISLKTGEQIAAASKALISLAVFAKSKDPVTTLVAGAAGNYTVDAYLDAAKKNDPLIILLPTIIPSKKLTSDVYKTVTQIKVPKEAQAVISTVITEAKSHPEDLIAPTITVPIKIARRWFGL